MAYLVACSFVSISAHRPSHEFLANILNAMEMHGRVKRKIVVNDKLVIISFRQFRWRLVEVGIGMEDQPLHRLRSLDSAVGLGIAH